MHEAWMRLLSIGILVSYSVYAQVVVAGRRRAERALRENHSWLATTLRSIGDAVIATDSEGNISLMNPTARTLTGWDEEEAIGNPIAEVFDISNELTGEKAECPVARVLKEGVVVGLANHTVLTARDGTRRPIDDSGAPILDDDENTLGAVLVFHDVTEKRRAERALRESEAWLSTTLNAIGDAVIATDRDGHVTFANPVAEGLTGWGREEALGEPLTDVFNIVNEETGEQVEDPVARVLREGVVVGLGNHTALIAKDGTRRPIDDSGAPIRDADGNPIGAVLVFHDVTEKRRAEKELRESEQKFRLFFENEPEYCYMISPEGVILDVNASALAALGYAKEELVGKPLQSIYASESLPKMKQLIEEWRKTGGVKDEEMVIVGAGGTKRSVLLSAAAVRDEEGNTLNSVSVQRDITDRKRAEEALRQERDRAQQYLDLAGVMFVAIDAVGVVMMVNRKGCEILGYREDEIVGKSWFGNFVTQEVRDEIMPVSRELLTGELDTAEYHENAILTRSGEERLIAWHNTVLRDAKGNIFAHLSSGEDITDRKRAANQRSLALGVLELLNKSGERHDCIHDILRLVKDATGLEAVGIRLAEGADFPYYEINGFGTEFVEAENYLCEYDGNGKLVRDGDGDPCLDCMCGNVIRGRTDASKPFFTEGGSFWTNSTTELLASTTEQDRQGRTRNRCNREGYESVALVPLRAGSKTVGLLQLNDHRRGRCSLELIAFLEGLGASIGVALRRRQTEEALRESEGHLAKSQEIAHFGHWRLDPATGAVSGSDELFRIFSLTREEATLDAFAEVVHPDDREYDLRHIRRGMEHGESWDIEHRLICRDGKEKSIRAIGKAITDDAGRVVMLVGTVQDITDRKRAEEGLRASERMHRTLAENIPGIVYRVFLRENNRMLFLNDMLSEMTGFNADELGSGDVCSIEPRILEEDRPAVIALVKESIVETRAFTAEYRYKHKDGSIRHFHEVGRPVFDAQGEPEFIDGVILDVTEHKQAEQALQESEDRFRRLFQQAPIAYQSLDADGNILEVNQAWLDMLGYARDEVLGNCLSELLSPESAKPFRERFSRFKEAGETSGSESKMLHKDGTLVEVTTDGRISYDKLGRFQQTHCVLHNVTERKRAEKKLRASEERYRSFVQNFKGIAFRGDMEFVPLFFHGAVDEITGYSEEAFKAGSPRWDQVIHPDDLKDITERDSSYLRTIPDWSTEREYRIVRKDGQVRWVHESMQNVCDDSGKPVFVQGAIYDITARKRTEKALAESEERYRKLFEDSIEGIGVSQGNRVVSANRAVLDILGYDSLEELARVPLLDLVAPESRQMIRERIVRRAQGEPVPPRYEYKTVRKNGEIRDMAISTTEVTLAGEKCVLSTFRDITDRKRAEELLRIGRDLAVALSAAPGLDEGLPVCLDAALDASGMDCGGVYTVDQTTGAVDLVHHVGLSLDFVNTVSHYDAGSANARVVMAGEPIYTQHLKLAVPLTEDERRESLRAMAIIPVRHEGRVIACLNVASHDFDEVPLNSREALETIAAQIGSAIARLRVEDALRVSEARFRALTESTSDWIWEVDENGVYTYASPKVTEILGYEPEEVIGKTPFDFMPPEEARRIAPKFRAAAESREPFAGLDNINRHKDGRLVVLETSGVPVFNAAGDLRGYRGVDRDITDRKRAEEQLRESEELHRTLVSALPEAVTETDLEGRITFASRQTLEMHGYEDAEELLGRSALDLVSQQDCERAEEGLRRTLKEGAFRDAEYMLLRKDGTRFPAELSAAVIKDAQGRPEAFVAITRDVTDRKQAEERESQYRRRLQALTTQLSETEEQGRRQFARDLHDRVGQPLAMARMTLSDATGKLSDADAVLRERIGAAATLLEQVNQETRAITLDLHPPILDNFGLGPAIEWAAKEFATAAGLKVVVRDEYAEPLEPPELRAYLFRAVKELLVNAAKHAEASEAVVHLRSEGDALHVSVSDDGKGFDVDEAMGRGGVGGGIGLFSIEERLASFGGVFKIDSTPGRGSSSLITVPLKNTEPRP
jgi:PAS domain S-box-containing protein